MLYGSLNDVNGNKNNLQNKVVIKNINYNFLYLKISAS